MCNEVYRYVTLGEMVRGFENLRVPTRFPQGRPNFAATASVRITDATPIIRAANDDPAAAELVLRRWSWPGAGAGAELAEFRGIPGT